MRIGVSQVKKAINLFQEPQKIIFTFRFWHKSFILAELSNNSFESKNVTFLGVKHTPTPPTYFKGVKAS